MVCGVRFSCLLGCMVEKIMVHSFKPQIFKTNCDFQYIINPQLTSELSLKETMMEISRREKQEGIVPDLDIDTYMKVMTSTFLSFNQYCTLRAQSQIQIARMQWHTNLTKGSTSRCLCRLCANIKFEIKHTSDAVHIASCFLQQCYFSTLLSVQCLRNGLF